MYNITDDYQFFTFGVDKAENLLTLISLLGLPSSSRTQIIFDDNNRSTVLPNLDQQILNAMQILPSLPSFFPESLIYDIIYFSYSSSMFTGTNTSLSQTMFIFKYYIPVELNLTSEFIEFKVRVIATQVPSVINTIVVPKEVFREVEED